MGALNDINRWLLLLSMVDGRNKKIYVEIYREFEALAYER